MMARLRRLNEHPAWNWAMVAGFLVIPAAFAFKAKGWVDRDEFWGTLVLSAFLIRPDRLVDLARARFGNRPDPPSEGGTS